MKHSVEVGLSFGVTSGIITTLGLMVGLNAGTHSRLAVIGGILTIAIADAFSDALGIHVSEESEGKHTQNEIWLSTLSTFAAKFIVTVMFLVPVMLLDLAQAIAVSIVFGLAMLCILSHWLARREGSSPLAVVGEHLLVAVLVIAAAHLAGAWIASVFG